jgi:putative phage-type endonuclease
MLNNQQIKARKSGIGGSDAAAVCGISKWKTPLDIYIDKKSETSEEINNKYIYWGNRMEGILVDEYQKQTGKSVSINNPIFRHPEHTFMLANIDGLAEDGAIVECKTTSYTKEWGEPGTDEIPEEYLLQCAHYAIIFDAPRVDIPVLISGNDFRIYSYKRNKSLENLLIEKEKDFWVNNVLASTPPPPSRPEDFAKAFANTRGEMKVAGDSIKHLIKTVNELNSQIKELESKKDTVIFTLKECIADYDGLSDDSGNILATWKIQSSNRFDVTALKSSSPQVYNQFLKQSSSRVFRVKEI